MIIVVGFSVLGYKPRGKDGIFYFQPADRFAAESPPSEDEMRKYCDAKGYDVPTGTIPVAFGMAAARHCEPVYVYEGSYDECTFPT